MRRRLERLEIISEMQFNRRRQLLHAIQDRTLVVDRW